MNVVIKCPPSSSARRATISYPDGTPVPLSCKRAEVVIDWDTGDPVAAKLDCILMSLDLAVDAEVFLTDGLGKKYRLVEIP
jgi:hypothetical protein